MAMSKAVVKYTGGGSGNGNESKYHQLIEDAVEIPGLLEETREALRSEMWSNCVKILNKHLKFDSPEYHELKNIEGDYKIMKYNSYGILHEAVKYSLFHLIAVFLKNKVSVNQFINSNNDTMLHVAAHYGQYENVKFLLSLGARVNARNGRKETPLHHAATNNHPLIVLLLLHNSADIDVLDCDGFTPLQAFNRKVFVIDQTVAKILTKYDQDRWPKL